MKKQLSYNLRIATLVMGITLSATVNAQNLLCVILDGDQTNDAIAILQVSKLGIARGALCYLDLTTTTTLDNCHPVTGTQTGVTKIKIGVSGEDLGEDGQVNTSTGAFTFTPNAIDQGKGSVITSAHAGGALPDIVVAAVQGKATPVLCKAKKARGTQSYPNRLTIPASSGVPSGNWYFPTDAASSVSLYPPTPLD